MTTIAYLGDVIPKDFGSAGVHEIMEDLNRIMELSPTGVNDVDAIFFVGDAARISQTIQAINLSDAKNIPIYFTTANYETESDEDMDLIYETYNNSNIQLNPGPFGTNKTTYSMDIDNFHIVNMNIYWNGSTNDRYLGKGAGGYIHDKLYQWVNNDLSDTTRKWKIVMSHSPLYPENRHIGESLDSDIVNRDKFENLLINQNVPIFMASHTHYASISVHDNIYHVDAGVAGAKTRDSNTDGFTSIMYTHTTNNGNNLFLTWKRENPTWDTPTVETIPIDGTDGGICQEVICSMSIE